MTDPFDDAKRSLEGVPAPDVWAEAERRASDGTVVPLAPVAARRVSKPGRWLAGAAALALLVAGTVAVLANDSDAPVDSGPAQPGSIGEAPAMYQADGACPVGIAGEPLPEPVTVTTAETFHVDPSGAESVGTLVEGSLNETQTYAAQVPGQVLTDLVGERVEEVQIERGTATLWFQTEGGVQVRWFTGSQEVCESFTVTVTGGTEDENRHAAVDLAERVLLPSDLPSDAPHPAPDEPGATSTVAP